MRVVVLAKQVPVPGEMSLGPDGRLQRGGVPLEMNAFCRRAVSAAIALAHAQGGECTVLTLGPPSAVRVLQEAIVGGADFGLHICGTEFAGSDTLATARALAAALRLRGPFDLILVGRNSIDSDTGQVGPSLSQLLDLPFVSAARKLEVVDREARCESHLDDGWVALRASLPAVVGCAERLCPPLKAIIPEDTSDLDRRIETLRGEDLGRGPWGEAASRTVVGVVRAVPGDRRVRMLAGTADEQVQGLVAALEEREIFPAAAWSGEPTSVVGGGPSEREGGEPVEALPRLGVVLEEGRRRTSRELLGEAARLAAEVGGKVTALVPERASELLLATWGADEIVEVEGWGAAEDFARALAGWARGSLPWMVVAPSTVWGREVAARAATELDSGLTGDAVALEARGGRLLAWKSALSGSALAAITATSAIQLVTLRPGVLPILGPRVASATIKRLPVEPRRRLHLESVHRDFDLEALLAARVVVGVGLGVPGDRHPELDPLLEALGAEIACTRRVADQGWLPRGRQVGLTGVSLRPDLYLALGVSGTGNHMVGVRGAGCVVAVNTDPAAEVFAAADFGLVGDWAEVATALEAAWKGSSRLARVG